MKVVKELLLAPYTLPCESLRIFFFFSRLFSEFPGLGPGRGVPKVPRPTAARHRAEGAARAAPHPARRRKGGPAFGRTLRSRAAHQQLVALGGASSRALSRFPVPFLGIPPLLQDGGLAAPCSGAVTQHVGPRLAAGH